MEISINGKPADIILETEKTVGDVLSGLGQWLIGTDMSLSGLIIDGLLTSAADIGETMNRGLEGIQNMDIRISSWDELALEALVDLREICGLYGNSSFEEKKEIRKNWEESAAAAFLSAEINDLYVLSCLCFAGEGLAPPNLGILAEERLRELADPALEIYNMEKPVSVISARMEDLPLDVQTGKDKRAAETIQLFSQMGEKIFRVLQILTKRGLIMESMNIESVSLKDFLKDFSAALAELTAAYKNQDAVLIGDLAEYELAPRLLKLFLTLKDFSQGGLSLEESRKGS